MKKRAVILTITAMVMASQLCGCGSALTKDIQSMANAGEQVDISVGTAEEEEEKGTATLADWEELGKLTDQEDLRDTIDEEMQIIAFGESKNGVMYVDPSTKKWESNNTLERAFKNKKFIEYWENAEAQDAIQNSVKEVYCDLGDANKEELKLAALNGYYNLIAEDEEDGYYNGDSTLTRAEFMTAVARASEQADKEAKADKSLIKALGDSKNTVYASYVLKNSYLGTEDGSLDETTFNSSMTRAEAVYLLVNKYYGKELETEEVKGETYEDCSNAGYIFEDAKQADKAYKKAIKLAESGDTESIVADGAIEKYTVYNRSFTLKALLNHPTEGIDEELYKALKVAYEHKLLTENGEEISESRWNEAITKTEALQMLVNVYYDLGTEINSERGESSAEEVEEKEEKAEAEKVLTKEEFKKQLGVDDCDLYYENYIAEIDGLGLTPEEALADTIAFADVDKEQSEEQQVADNTPAEQGNTTQGQGSGDSQPAEQTQPADTAPVETVPAEKTPEEIAAEEAEADRRLDEFNGQTGMYSGLTEEEREKEQEAWSHFSGQ